MFVVMNRFQVQLGREQDFEDSWRNRETYLEQFEGFVQFALLRNAASDGATEYISHTTWRSRADFEGWRGSEQFRQAHGQAGMEGVLAGPPQASLYESVLVQLNKNASPAPM